MRVLWVKKTGQKSATQTLPMLASRLTDLAGTQHRAVGCTFKKHTGDLTHISISSGNDYMCCQTNVLTIHQHIKYLNTVSELWSQIKPGKLARANVTQSIS